MLFRAHSKLGLPVFTTSGRRFLGREAALLAIKFDESPCRKPNFKKDERLLRKSKIFNTWVRKEILLSQYDSFIVSWTKKQMTLARAHNRDTVPLRARCQGFVSFFGFDCSLKKLGGDYFCKMFAIRFIEIALLLSLLAEYHLAAPRAVDYDSKTDNSKCRFKLFQRSN